MTLTQPAPTAAQLADLYAHMGVEALSQHLDAAIAALEAAGVELTPAARLGLDEIAECIVEHHARHNRAALGRHLSLLAPSDSPAASRPEGA